MTDEDKKQPPKQAGDIVEEAAKLVAQPSAEDELRSLRDECDKFKKIAQRAQADLVNYRRRVGEEREQDIYRQKRVFAFSMMDVADQLETALSPKLLGDAESSWITGIKAVYKRLIDALASQGFTRYDAIDCDFDPALHEAVISTPKANCNEGAILSQIRAGYFGSQGEVVRPAQVEIATNLTEQKEQESA